MLTTIFHFDVWMRLRDQRWGPSGNDPAPGVEILQPDPTRTNLRVALLCRHLDPYTAAEREAIQHENKPMKLIIAGGRGYQFTEVDVEHLDKIEDVTEVVSGGAQGADADGEEWAKMRGIPCKVFPPDWAQHGKKAGPIRNRTMAEYADAVVLFPGGKGTDSMFNEAMKAGLTIFDWRGK